MAQSARLRVADLRAIYCLVGQCRDFGDDPIAWRQHLLAGIARLTGAGSANNYEGQWEPFRPIGIVRRGLGNGFDQQAVLRIDEAFARHGLTFNPMFRPFMIALAQGLGPSLTRTDLVPDAVWYQSPYFRNYHAPAGSDAMLYCSLPLLGRGKQMSGLTLVRVVGERDFSPRDRLIVQEAHLAVTAWIGGPLARLDEPSPATLPRRLRQVLRCLVDGDSDKQIAARLNLSRYTVNEYVERIFCHFGVHTRPELLARWVRRGWGGRFLWADREPDAE